MVGDTTYITRFLLGFDEKLVSILKNNGLSDELIGNIMDDCNKSLHLPLGVPSMPMDDAIELVKFLAHISVESSKFVPGAQVIGGPIDIAVITKYEGFMWIDRKHYYDKNLNITIGGK